MAPLATSGCQWGAHLLESQSAWTSKCTEVFSVSSVHRIGILDAVDSDLAWLRKRPQELGLGEVPAWPEDTIGEKWALSLSAWSCYVVARSSCSDRLCQSFPICGLHRRSLALPTPASIRLPWVQVMHLSLPVLVASIDQNASCAPRSGSLIWTETTVTFSLPRARGIPLLFIGIRAYEALLEPGRGSYPLIMACPSPTDWRPSDAWRLASCGVH